MSEDTTTAPRAGTASRSRSAHRAESFSIPVGVATAPPNLRLDVLLREEDWSSHLADQTRRGLASEAPWIPPVWFYDEYGSALFDQITRLAEYYPTRTERGILQGCAADVARITECETLVELGAGSADKTQILLRAGLEHGRLRHFVPVDCSAGVLGAAADHAARRHPEIEVHGVVADFTAHLAELARGTRRLVVFLGSTIGNFDDDERAAFLAEVAADLAPGDSFLLGTDLIKSPDRLVQAYDDAQGVTAAFNVNALAVLNRRLGSDFDPSQFRHRAHWDVERGRIEMHLVAMREQAVTVPAFDDLVVRFAPGAHLRTEISTKFTAAQVQDELVAAGLAVTARWSDPDHDFLLTLARRL